MLFRLKQRLQFYLKSTNQHGVHSPFVYNLVTQCFYDNKKRNSYIILTSNYRKKNNTSLSLKTVKLLHRIPLYLQYKNICIINAENSFLKTVFDIGNNLSIHTSLENQNVFDLIYIDLDMVTLNKLKIKEIMNKTHNNSLILFRGISSSRKNNKYWESIIHLTDITVSIDTFYFGFIFFRKEQAKEHFVIRL